MTRGAVTNNISPVDKPGLIGQTVGAEGGLIISPGPEGLGGAYVGGWVESMTGKIEMMAHQCTFDPVTGTGRVPTSLVLIPEDIYPQAMKAMREAFIAKVAISDSIGVIRGEVKVGQRLVPRNVIGILSVSHIIYHGILLKCGIPAVPKFGGLLQIRNYEPLRFVELIECDSSSVDPSEVFLSCRMTSVRNVVEEGSGKILASFLEVPDLTRPRVESIIEMLEMGGVRGVIGMGRIGEGVCEVPVRPSHFGIVLLDGLNPVAAAVETGLDITAHTLGGVTEFRSLESLQYLRVGKVQ
jgi:repressor of nif and glnA expression